MIFSGFCVNYPIRYLNMYKKLLDYIFIFYEIIVISFIFIYVILLYFQSLSKINVYRYVYACNLSDEWLLNLMAALSTDQIIISKPIPMTMVFALTRLAKTHFHAWRFIKGIPTDHISNTFRCIWLIRIFFQYSLC